jgi:hypothetical protein
MKGNFEYEVLHKKNITAALTRMTQRALRISNEKTLVHKAVIDRTTFSLPKRFSKLSKRGTVINVGGQDILVKNDLGCGSHGTVLLCASSYYPQENIALKFQKDPTSLAWEYEVLEEIQNRTKNNTESSQNPMFPSPLTFTLFGNGASMGMTAASATGLTLLDVVNANNRSVPELLAIYYTSRMLKCLEQLHLTAKILVSRNPLSKHVLSDLQSNSNFK